MLKRRGTFYRNILILLLLIASIPGFITGLSIYWTVTGKVESELQRLHQNRIMQQEKNIEAQFASLELTFSHWAFDPNLGNKLTEIDFAMKYDQVNELYRTLLIIEGSNHLLGHAELYLLQPNSLILNKEGYFSVTDSKALQQYSSLIHMEKSVFWLDASELPAMTPIDGNTTLALVNKLQTNATEPYGLLMASLDPERLRQLLATLKQYNEGSALLINGDGKWSISTAGERSELDAALEAEYHSRGRSSDSFLFSYQNQVYSVAATQFSRLGANWVILSAAPLSSITAPVLFLSKVILSLSIGGIILVALLSWLASRRLYSPLERLTRKLLGDTLSAGGSGNEFEWIETRWDSMTKESLLLRNQLNRQLPILREGFLMQLAQGYLFAQSEDEIFDRLRQLGLNPDEKQFGAMVVQILLKGPECRFTGRDDELAAFAVGNIVKELGENLDIPCEVLNFHDSTLGLFLSFPANLPYEEAHRQMLDFAKELTAIMESILKLQTVAVIGHATNRISRLPYLFEEARDALNYRDLNGAGKLMDVRHVTKVHSQLELPYHFLLEKEIIHAIRMGQAPEAVKLIDQFMDGLTAAGVKKLIIQQGMNQLLGSIQHAMLQSGVNPIVLFEGANLHQELAQLQEPGDMVKWLKDRVVQPYVDELASRQDAQLKQLVESVLAYINQNYKTDLSLDSCAERFNTTPYTLSRAIKQVTGINFIDYLTNLRIGMAKELLRTTHLKINEVAEQVGYQHTYFNRIFKKTEGLPPSQYRENAQKQNP